jgi:hypothetical protein
VTRHTTFSYRSARSGSFLIGISAAILIETAAVHLVLVSRLPLLAFTLTTLSVLAIIWLVRDYLALGRQVVQLDDETLRLKVGRRFDISVSLANITRVLRPSFRDLPTPGTNQGRDYLNLTKPASPNVLIVLQKPIRVRFTAGLHRLVSRFSLHLDEPDAFVSELVARQAAQVTAAT